MNEYKPAGLESCYCFVKRQLVVLLLKLIKRLLKFWLLPDFW
jgi:hypothetical protein